MRILGLEESRGGLSLARHGRESRAETVSGILLPRVFLFVECEPEADTPGMVYRSFALILTFDVLDSGSRFSPPFAFMRPFNMDDA